MKAIYLLVLSVFVCVSCTDTEQYNNIYGTWTCSEWIVPSTGQDNCSRNTVSFNFKENLTYTYQYSTLKEEGVYRISGNSLYTKPDGKLEIGVEINTLTADSLQVIMSRAGEKEILTLLKQPK